MDLLESTGSLWDNDVTVVLFYFQLLRHTSTVVTSPGVSRISPHQCHFSDGVTVEKLVG